MKVSELVPVLNALADKMDKVKAEVQALKDALANVDLPPDAQKALDRLDVAIKATDDINPDTTLRPGQAHKP